MNAKSLAGNAAKEIFNPDVDMLKQNVERKNQNSEYVDALKLRLIWRFHLRITTKSKGHYN